MRERDTSLTTDQKALAVNLDKYKFGTIVEIGAGQEVARRSKVRRNSSPART